jgi:tripartite-type tricarboxylate transporter receptor subunit TctC
MMRTVFVRSVLLFLSLIFANQPAQADTYPNKPIRWIVPWPPGGGADVLARLLATKVSEGLGQQIIIDNRGGAAGNIGAQVAAQAAPDGYTMVFAYSGTHSINPYLYKKMPFKESDFAPVIFLTSVPQVLVVNQSVPVKSVNELISLAKSKPGTLTYASSGNGAINHLTGELFSSMAGIQLLHVPYKGGGPASVALMSGEVDMIFGEPATIVQQVKSGKLKAIAVTSAKRSLGMPDLPTIGESGVPGYEVTSWNGLMVPAKTPPEIIARLNAEFNKVLAMPDMRQRLIERGFEPVGGEPERFARHIQAELAKWGPVVRKTGISID